MKVLFGLATHQKGTILHKKTEISGWRTDRIVGRGIAYVPQVDNVFPSLSVHENLQMGGLNMGSVDLQNRLDQACEMFPEMQLRMSDLAASLSGVLWCLRVYVHVGLSLYLCASLCISVCIWVPRIGFRVVIPVPLLAPASCSHGWHS